MFARQKTPQLIGMVHLLPLPGAPTGSPGLSAVVARAVADARTLRAGGAQGLVIENMGDAPFARTVDAFTVAAMTTIAASVREAVPDLICGINVLRNDALAALAIATAVGAEFVRVNVHVGTMVTDQGLIEGGARQTLLERTRLGSKVKIAADVLVKHAVPLGACSLVEVALDTVERGKADIVIHSGSRTGRPPELGEFQVLREVLPNALLWLGSGLTPKMAPVLVGCVDAVIVGTYLHEDSNLERPLAIHRVEQVVDALVG
ncbi:MAG: BtpA/SgcQ family protein [Proteobacteria bacterium]|jgi:uncharacterized protein|nr:BtpA/SgcQ family protein [Pseudomonadota bacterium]